MANHTDPEHHNVARAEGADFDEAMAGFDRVLRNEDGIRDVLVDAGVLVPIAKPERVRMLAVRAVESLTRAGFSDDEITRFLDALDAGGATVVAKPSPCNRFRHDEHCADLHWESPDA